MNSFLVGLQFLTRIRITNQVVWEDQEFGKSVKWFPLYGWIIGAFLCLIYFLMDSLQTPLLTGFILVLAELFISGGTLHDGLMDSADGLYSGRSKERCLEIMKDSLVGSFGILSVLIYFFLMTISLSEIKGSLYMILIAMPTLGRFNMVISICKYPYARPYGMGKSFSYYKDSYAVTFAFVFATLPALYFGFNYLLLEGAAILLGLWLNRFIVNKIDGTTGDTYGFVTQVTEAFLAFLCVLITRGTL